MAGTPALGRHERAADTANIQALLDLGGITVQLAPGNFYLSAPLTIPPYTALAGR